jgi:hypothetical protein
MPHPSPPDSRPGDLVGRDTAGKVRIDRVIPLPWLVGMMAAIVAQAAALYYGQQQTIEKVGELRADVRSLNGSAAVAATRDVEHTMRLQALERRVDVIETTRTAAPR